MFVQATKFIEAHGGNTKAVNVYGQESEPATYRLAKMNLAIRGISYHLGNRAVSTFSNDQHKDNKFDYIMANPPFNLKKYAEYGEFETDPRWKGYAIPPTSNANYAWILHMLNKLNVVDGVAGFLLANGALDDDDTKEIRQKLVENDKVEAIIVLPREMFYSTDISVTLWILNNNKKGGPRHGRQLRNREGEILFVDLRTWNQNIYEKKYVKLAEEQISDVCKIYFDWQTTKVVNYAKPELYYAAHIDEVRKKGFSLVPSRYVEFVEKKSEINWRESLNALLNINASLKDACSQSQKSISEIINLLSDLDNKFGLMEIGPYIEEIDERNSDLKIKLSQGIANTKVFQDPKQVSVNSRSDKIVRTGCFAYNRATTRNGEKISIAYRTGPDCTVSSAYGVFRITDENIIDPYFLWMWFSRSEFDRYARYKSKGSAHEFFEFEEMRRVKIPKAPIEVQRTIASIYKCANEAKQIAAEADKLSREVCPALLQHIVCS